MIINGWLDWTIKRDGPSHKVYSQINTQQGIVLHSMEGWLAGSFGELDKPDRQASWHFSNALTGVLFQHYPITVSCWASGSMEANTRYLAVESEGMTGTPLNENQLNTMEKLLEELGFSTHGVDIFEHNEVATLWGPNAGPTSCPSHRYDPLYERLGDNMSQQDKELLYSIARALTGMPDPVSAKSFIDQKNAMGMAFLQGYTVMWNNLWRHMNSDMQAHPNGLSQPWSDI